MDERERQEVFGEMQALRAELERLKGHNRILEAELRGEHTGWPVRRPEAEVRPQAQAARVDDAPVLEQAPSVPTASVVPAASPIPPASPWPERGEAVAAALPRVDGARLCPDCGEPRRLGARECFICGHAYLRTARNGSRFEAARTGPAGEPAPFGAAAGRAGTEPEAAPARDAASPEPDMIERLCGWVQSLFDAAREQGAERVVGEKLFNYAGVVLLVLGGAFFLKYTHALLGPAGKLAIGLAAGALLAGVGERLRRDPDFEPFSLPVIGGGWILLYYTVFAAHYIPASKVVGSAAFELLLLCGVAAGMIGHSLAARSRVLTTFAFGTAFGVFAITHMGVPTLTVCALLALTGALLVGPLENHELAAVSLAGFYLNYMPVFRDSLAASRGNLPVADFWYGLALATAVHGVYAWLTPQTSREGRPRKELDAVLSVSAVLYAAMFCAQTASFAPEHATAALFGLAAALASFSALTRGPEETALSSVQGFLAAAVTVLAVARLDTLGEAVWALALAAGAFGALGFWLGRRSLDRYGLWLTGLAGFLWVLHSPRLAASNPVAHWPTVGLAFAYLSGMSADLAALRESSRREPVEATARWAWVGLAAGVMALRSWLAPAPFAVAVTALALGLEVSAAALGSARLFRRALALELLVGLYAFILPYGANEVLFLGFTSRMLVTLAVTSGLAAAVFGAAILEPERELLGLRHADWRRLSAWLMTAVAAYGLILEARFGPMVRVPALAGGALLLMSLGRGRGPVGVDLRLQGGLLMLACAWQAVASFIAHPELLAGGLGWGETAVYWASSLALLAPQAFPAWGCDDGERSEERLVAYLSAILSLGLLAAFIGREAGGVWVTLGWTLVGVPFLVAGLAFERPSLRLPGMALLGLCVGKALFRDLSGLDLPYRVLSYTVLGGLLVLSSYLYVRATKGEGGREARS